MSIGIKADVAKNVGKVDVDNIDRLGTTPLTQAEGDKVEAKFVIGRNDAKRLLSSKPKSGVEAYFKSENKPIAGNTERAITLAAAAKMGKVDKLAEAVIDSIA